MSKGAAECIKDLYEIHVRPNSVKYNLEKSSEGLKRSLAALVVASGVTI